MNKKMLYRCGLEKLGDASSLLTVAGALLILIVFFAIGTPYFLSEYWFVCGHCGLHLLFRDFYQYFRHD